MTGNMRQTVFRLAVLAFVSGTMALSAPSTRQFELYRWVDFPFEAPEAASGIG